MKQIPANRSVWTQPNTSDVIGDIFISKSLDLTDNAGKVRVGKRLILGGNTTDMGVLANDVPVAFRIFNHASNNKILGIVGSGIAESVGDYPGSGFVGFSGTLPIDLASFNSDMEIYGSDLYITGQTGLYKLAFGTTNWSTALYSSLGSASKHLLCYYQGYLYVTNNDNQIYGWDGSTMHTTPGTLSCTIPNPAKNQIMFMRAGANRIWIGTKSDVNAAGARGYVYEWNGSDPSPAKEHRVESPGVLSCVIKDDVPWVIDVYGRLLAWNGGTFIEKARLNRRRNQLFKMDESDALVAPNGMAVINGRINILVNGTHYDANGTMEETVPSGVWEYDEVSNSLYHKHAFGLSHTSDTITDYGANRIAKAGALYEVNYPDSSSSRNGTFVAGANYYTDATTITSGIFSDDSNDTLQKAGYIVTQKVEATDGSIYNFPTVESMWQSVFTLYRKLLANTDKIVVKYRTQEVDPIEQTISWASTTSFSVPTASFPTMSSYWTSGTGGEVEIMQGIGAGKCAHITNVTTAGALYIITIDETFTGATGTSVARFQNWKKVSSITPNNQNFNSDTIGVKSTWIQFKLWMLFTGRDELERILLSNNNDTPVK
jgi:hypothetical protein